MTRLSRIALVAAGVLCASAANAQQVVNGGEVNISGATLFEDFFQSAASTNDSIDVDNDGFFGFDPMTPPFAQQLATEYVCGGVTTWWQVSYRGVGSGNGLAEFVDFQLLGLIPTTPPSDVGYLNRLEFANEDDGPTFPCPSDCDPNVDACCATGTPICPTSMDLGVTDVPVRWFVTDNTAAGAWDTLPGAPGYGQGAVTSWDTGFVSALKSLSRGMLSLNINIDNPDANTVYDTQVAFVPISLISNRGTGIDTISATQAQHHWVTGRFPNGENFVAATRDAGSGTRNGAMNTLGIDPAWGRGDNLGNKQSNDPPTSLGPQHQPTNCGGSGIMENVVINRRLAIGYTGLAGGSRSAVDASVGRYEILDVIFDDRGGNLPVRPTIAACVLNDDPNTGYQIGGPETFASRGNPATTDPNDPTFMANQAAADYLRNITGSTAAFEAQPGATSEQFMPGRFLADTFFLLDGINALPDLANPTNFVPNPNLNTNLRTFILNNNDLGGGLGFDTPAFGSVNNAGLVPQRIPSPGWIALPCPPVCQGIFPLDGEYSDGSVTGAYADLAGNFTVPAGAELNDRNAVAGDFNNDGVRNVNDADALMDAIFDPRAFATAEGDNGGDTGGLLTDHVIPEIIGDFNGDGNFGLIVNPVGGGTVYDTEDARYFADGLAVDPNTGNVDRRAGFTAVDNGWFTKTGNLNFFNTALATGVAYKAGDSRADIAGNTAAPGAQPTGHDGIVDCQDIAYICANFGDWSDINVAVNIDFSADMNGDLVIDNADVQEVVQNILQAQIGDVNLDGVVDNADRAIIVANQGNNGCWCDGDVNFDGVIDGCDLAAAGFFFTGDINQDGSVDSSDLNILLSSFGGTGPADLNQDGVVDSGDLNILLSDFGRGCP